MNKTIIAIALLLVIGGGIFLYTKERRQTSPQGTNKTAYQPTSESSSESEESKINQGLTIKILEPREGQRIVANSNFLIKGQTAPNAEVFIADRETKANNQGIFSTNLTLEQGENIITILANDENGNFAEETLRITLQSAE